VSVDARPAPDEVRTVAVIGTGVIGGGWAAHFLRMGYDVVAWDPGPQAESRLRSLVDTAWPALTRLGLGDGADRSRLRFAGSMTEALAGAHFVQESSPEVLDSKVALLAAIDAATPAEVVIGSSTSGFAMSDMAVECATPGRLVVGHPFNPPYLIPLVEVVGGARTDPAAVAWAEAFYTRAGKVCLTLDHEVPGFVANRLQEALWREALHMVDSGQATVQQIDDSIAYGPGLRWALMGPMLTFHLAGGEGGMAHMLDHFGPALLEPWTRLAAPTLTSLLRDRVVAGADEEAGGRSVTELEQQRDAFLVDLLVLLDKHRSRPPRSAAGPDGGAPLAAVHQAAVLAADG
jgi:carnitine 3-dehydrogenase